MPRSAVAIYILTLLAVPAIAGAKDKLEPRTQAMLACASVTPGEARLRCYDQSVIALQQALGKGQLVLNEKKGPKELGGVVKTSGTMGNNRFWVELGSGDRWHLLPATVRSEPPKVGTAMKVKKGIASNYWISGPGWSTSPAKHVARGQ